MKKDEKDKMEAMDHSKMDYGEMDHSKMDHSKMDHGEMDHSKMDHGEMDHSKMDHGEMDHSDHGMDHSMHANSFKKKLVVSIFLSLPILFLSPMMGVELPFQFSFKGSQWVVLIFATALFIYGGEPFISGARSELRKKSPGMMMLISMGISASYIYSVYAFVMNNFYGQDIMDFFWELASLILIMLLGHWVEMSAVSTASNALKKLAELLPDEVTRVRQDGTEEKISLQDVHEGDYLIVRAGDKMPTDGIIESGDTIVDESAITGESKGVVKLPGDEVIGGSVNGNGTISIKVTGTGKSGYLAKVMTMVEDAQKDKSNLEALSDKVAKWLFYVAVLVGLVAFFVWLALGDLPIALERMVTVFIIACPHALGLAIPLVVARSTSIAAQNGLLLKNRNALENAHDLNMVLLDKTGTLTQGTFSVTGVDILDPAYSREEALKYIGALESSANHPIAHGIMSYIVENNIDFYQAEGVQNITGIGLEARVHGKLVRVVNAKALEEIDYVVEPGLILKYQEQGNTISYLLIDNRPVALIALGDVIKEEAKSFIASLKARGLEPMILTGDNESAAANVARYLGIDNYYAELLPENKEEIVRDLIQEGNRLAMVGDGINDAPSLARATVGIAIGAGTDVAIDSADVVLINSNPEDILHFLDLAKQTRRKMIENLWWGAGYNIVAIPLAAGVLASIGIILSPAVGAVLMSLSTVIVAVNAMTLKIKK